MDRKTVKFLAMVWAIVLLIVLLFIVSVKGMDSKDIDQRIYMAEIHLSITRQDLASRDRELYRRYVTQPYSIDGHTAELELREKYPEQYSRYIQAKAELDDLQYEKFLMFANAEHDKEV